MMKKASIPKVATVAINVKGADLLFLDHIDSSEQNEVDRRMWKAAGVNIDSRPFGRVLYYVPLADDGINRNTLRTNKNVDQRGYSETREFALGIQDIWPYLDLFFGSRSTPAINLLAEVQQYFEETNGSRGFTLREVIELFKTEINQPQKGRKGTRWEDISLSTIKSVHQRFRSLPSTLGGLIDVTGKGFGLEKLADLQPRDMVVVDIERIMANPRDPEVAENAVRIITAYVLSRLTEAMTRRAVPVDHIIVFADELNRLAPRREGGSNGGIGDYLSQLARTTRDRGIVLFGAGQFRSGINEDILKAASVHYSMQTPDYELNDRIYSTLSPEFKARLTQLRPGETLLQYPSLRTAVFARFPRPFVLTGALKWQEQFPYEEARSLPNCVTERLTRLDPTRPPQEEEVARLLRRVISEDDRKMVGELLRDVEADGSRPAQQSPWDQFSRLIQQKLSSNKAPGEERNYTATPANWGGSDWAGEED